MTLRPVGWSLVALAAACSEPPRTWPRPAILNAIVAVESGGQEHPPDGDDGLAIGVYQIHQEYWQDAMQFEPDLGGTYQDCRDRRYAEAVIDAYMRRYVPDAWAAGDARTIARTHNGGPRGAEKEGTLGYWAKVRARLPPHR